MGLAVLAVLAIRRLPLILRPPLLIALAAAILYVLFVRRITRHGLGVSYGLAMARLGSAVGQRKVKLLESGTSIRSSRLQELLGQHPRNRIRPRYRALRGC